MARRGRLIAASVALVCLALSFFPGCFAADYEYIYGILDGPDGSNQYQLTVSVTSSLYDYYTSKDHDIYGYLQLDKFVTPGALSPIAEDLQDLYQEDEDFANGVLMIVHQIPYEASGPQKYPVETIVENVGDCDLLSFIAASIMSAGGLDVVLLYYEQEGHMNVGVHLSQTPKDARFGVYYYMYNGIQYYMAECTGGDWENGWRVGECPDMLKQSSTLIVPLDDYEESPPGQVSSNFDAPASSPLSLALSRTRITVGRSVTISGSISPVYSSENVAIYVSPDGNGWTLLGTVVTDSEGQYLCTWATQIAGTYYIKASWSGNEEYAGADSEVRALTFAQFSQQLFVTLVLVSTITITLVLVMVGRRTAAHVLDEVRVNIPLK